MASELRLDFLRTLPQFKKVKKPKDIATALALEDGYIAVIQFDGMGTYFASCRTVEELEEVLGSPNCHNKELLYCIPSLIGPIADLVAKGVVKMKMPK